MLIGVTGGTGYLGAHCVRALLARGDEVRLLVAPDARDAAVLRRFEEVGGSDIDVLVGDVRDSRTIDELLDGCDAMLHAAGVVGTDNRRNALMWQVNALATEAVLTRAAEEGLDPVVSVSSYSALFPPPNGVIGPDSPTVEGRSTYAQTKGYADRVARHLQSQGAPVVVTYPSSVVGPAFHTQPGVTERGWAPLVRWGVAPRLRGAMQMIDALERGSGRHLTRIPLSRTMFRGLGHIGDALSGIVPLGDGLSYEAALLLTSATPTDDSATLADFGITWRSPTDAIVASFPRYGLQQDVADTSM